MREIIVKSLVIVGLSGILAAVYAGCGYEASFDKIARETPGECEPEEDKGDCTRVYTCEDEAPITSTLIDGEDCWDAMNNRGKCNESDQCKLNCGLAEQRRCMCSNEHPCLEGKCTGEICVECTNDDHCNEVKHPEQDKWRCLKSECVSCANGRKDTDEAGVDCGGKCTKKCNGSSCGKDDSQCKSGFCVDGVCCDQKCDSECYSCSLPGGSKGRCTPVAPGDDDNCKDDLNPITVSGCRGDHMCMKTGGNGEICVVWNNCLSGNCDLGICKP